MDDQVWWRFDQVTNSIRITGAHNYFRRVSRARSPYILNTSSNLLGLCLIVMTSLKIANKSEAGFIDELTGLASVLLMGSCVLSFLSMRTLNAGRGDRLESAADVVFIGGLSFVFLTIVLIAFHFIA